MPPKPSKRPAASSGAKAKPAKKEGSGEHYTCAMMLCLLMTLHPWVPEHGARHTTLSFNMVIMHFSSGHDGVVEQSSSAPAAEADVPAGPPYFRADEIEQVGR